MKRHLFAVVALAWCGFAQAQERGEEVILPERVPLEDIGPSYVEGMDVALARQALMPDVRINPKGRGDDQGVWRVPPQGAAGLAHSGDKYITNSWGDSRMGIGFPAAVDVAGAWIGGQADYGVWPRALQVIGYREGLAVGESALFADFGAEQRWFAMDLRGVDRIEFVVVDPNALGTGFYALDDLIFRVQGSGEVVRLDFEDLSHRERLTDTGYAGLRWETGTGDFLGVPAPRVPQGYGVNDPLDSDTGPLPHGVGTAPTLVNDFGAVIRGDAGSFSFPPDTCGAAGPDHVVVMANRNFAVYDKDTGQELVNILSTSFLPGSNGDPRVHYDTQDDRWVVLITDFNQRFYLAYSLTDDPTGNWFKTSFTVGCTFPDYPTLGVDADGIYMASWVVNCGTMTIFAVDKTPLLDPTPSLGNVFLFQNLPFEGAIQPVKTHGNPSAMYFVSRSSSTSIRVRSITGMPNNPSLSNIGFASIPSHSSPPNAPALGSTTPLNTVGHRLMNSVYRDGSIWTAHTISVGGRAACRWYEINAASATLAQSGTVSDPSLYYFFPGIDVNDRGDVVMGFSGSNAGQYAGAYYTGRKNDDPPGDMAAPVQYRQGDAPQNNIDGSGRNRWGDYSLTAVDPQDDLTFFTFQEYAHANNIWGIWVAELEYDGLIDPVIYCTPKTNSCGGLPAIDFFGTPSATATSGFRLFGLGARQAKGGLVLYTDAGRAAIPFEGGLLCVAPQVRRSSQVVSQGGTPSNCESFFELDMNAFASGLTGGNPAAYLQLLGQQVNAQFWGRDTVANGSYLSDGVEYFVGP